MGMALSQSVPVGGLSARPEFQDSSSLFSVYFVTSWLECTFLHHEDTKATKKCLTNGWVSPIILA
jgi:hypothetical protein